MPDGLAQVSVESSDGRVLTGMGTTTEALEQTIQRHEPEPAPETAPAEPKAPRPSRTQQRFTDLTSERDKALHQAAEAARERDDLRQRLDAASKTTAPAPVEPPPAARPAPATGQKFTFPAYDAFLTDHPDATWDAWNEAKVEALADWKIQQLDFGAQVRTHLEADRANRALTDTLTQQREQAKSVYPDFEVVLQSGPGATIKLGPDDATASRRIRAILALPQSVHVQYAIAHDASLASRLQQMDDVTFGLTVATLAPGGGAASPASTPAPVSSIAPPPFQPVGSGSKTTVLPSAELPQRAGFDFDKSGYRERRAAERGIRRR